jgi:chromosome segregation ATPase
MTPEEELLKATADLSAVSANASALASEVSALTVKVGEAEAKVAALSAEKVEVEAKMSAISKDLEASLEKIKALEASEAKVEKVAARIASECGVAPVAVSPGVSGIKSREEALTEMSKITDPAEKQKFFMANQKVLLGL